MIAYRELVDVVLEKDPTRKVHLAAETFLDTTVFTGLAVTYRQQSDPAHNFLFTQGYADDALSYLRDNYITENPMYRRAVAEASVLTWHGGQFAKGDAARWWLSPVGYQNGFSVSLEHEGLGEIGSVHANSYVPEFGDQQLDAVLAFSELLISVLSQKREQDNLRLTARELHVVRLIVTGASNPEIAKELCVSRSTVATHVENILRKLGTHSRVGIAVEATRIGLAS